MTTLKEKIFSLLLARDADGLARLARSDRRVPARLVAMANDKGDLMGWRAIEGLGYCASAMAAESTRALRNLAQRILWSAREESGGMGWSAPELLAEIACADTHRFSDLPPIIVSLHGDDEEKVFLKGVLRAIARMRQCGITDVPGSAEVVAASLGDIDPEVRGLAVLALADEAGAGQAAIADLVTDQSLFQLYRDGQMLEMTVAEAVSEMRERSAAAPRRR